MKLKLLQIIIMSSKYLAYGVFVQVFLMNLLVAGDLEAQKNLSVREVGITINQQEYSLDDLLSEIESKTAFTISYDKAEVRKQLKQAVTITSSADLKVSDVLIEVAMQTGLKFRQVNQNISVIPNGKGSDEIIQEVIIEDVDISGKITDETGEPLPGATVLEKGTSNGVTTNLDGNYKLRLPEDATITVSFVGYISQEIIVGAQSTIDVQMTEDAQQLDELVVVGYGTQKKSLLTNAVSQVSGDIINKSPTISMANSLSGRMSGVFVTQNSSAPGSDDATIRIRGSNTYRNNEALIVIDGVASVDGINRLDPNDIAKVTVLKDASAAIYGAQSAGGVILITTKRGEAGKMKANYSFTQSFQSMAKVPEYASAVPYMNAVNSADILNGNTQSFPDELITNFSNGTRTSTDWLDDFYGGQAAAQNRHSLSLSGGTEDIRYFTSIGTSSQEGLMVGDEKTENKQINLRLNVDVKAHKNLDIGVDLSVRRKFTQTPQAGTNGGGMGTSPLVEAFIDGDPRYPSQGWSHLNPAARVRGVGYTKRTDNVLIGTVRYKYTAPFVEGLSLEGFVTHNRTWEYDKGFNYPWDYWEKDVDGNIVKVKARDIDPEGLREDFAQNSALTLNTKIAYTKSIGDHKIDAFFAYEQREGRANNFWSQRLGYDSKLIDQLFAGSENTDNFRNNGTASEDGRQNYFGRVSYDFQSKYMLGFNFRYDGSITFPKDSRFGFFPGISAGWRISEEAFFGDGVVDNLKLRLSWGQLGNDRVDQFQYLGIYKYGVNSATGIGDGYVFGNEDIKGVVPDGVANPNITWEVSNNLDIGVELGLFDGAINLEVDVFKIKTTNILGRRQASIPAYTGLDLPDENIGEMENQGIDLSLNYRHTFGEELYFGIGGTMTYAKNKIIYFDEAPNPEVYQNLEGTPLGSALVYQTIGIYRTAADLSDNVSYTNAGLGDLIFADLNGDGLINSDDRYRFDPMGDPRMQYGLNFDLSFKGFDFNILFQGASNVKRRYSNGFSSSAGGNGFAYAAENSYTVDNTDAILPRIASTTLGNQNSDFWYRNSGYVRLKSMEFGYTIPQALTSQVGINNLRVYVSGYNLLTFQNNNDLGYGDPEQGNGGYPPLKTVSFGVNVSF
ncbi:MAG: TonB-linked SusC/RagA family outer membrane protein [Parvicella sp.]|jgi:TonB-linked SusC/RagA family outer membrane protein